MHVVIRLGVSKNEQLVRTVNDAKLSSLDSSKRLERRASRPAAIGAMAVQRILKGIGDLVRDCATKAVATQSPSSGTTLCGAHRDA